MKTNPWMIVSLVLALACGYLLGQKTENDVEAATPKYQYFINWEEPKFNGKYYRVNVETGVFQVLRVSSQKSPMSPNLLEWVDDYIKREGTP